MYECILALIPKIFWLCENLLSPYNIIYTRVSFDRLEMLFSSLSRQGNHAFDHHMPGNAARTVQYLQYTHRYSGTSGNCVSKDMTEFVKI